MVNRSPDMPMDPRLEQAVDWHARLQGDADQAVWLEFTAWLEADPTHRAAYDQVEDLWRQLDGVAAAPGTKQAPEQRVVDFASRRRTSNPPANLSRRWFMGGSAVAAAAVLAVTLVGRRNDVPLPEIYETAPGQRHTVRLADGSTVTLNSGTRLTVALSEQQRAVVLEKGEALFDVAKDPARPFTVAAGERLVTVVGTAFNVRHLDQSVTVTVARGLVDVGDRDGGGKVRLIPGQQVSAGVGKPLGPVVNVDPASVTAWREGRLVFDQVPLAQVLAELSQHYPLPMRAEGTAAQLRFSGVLRLEADQGAVLATLQSLMPVAVRHQGDSFVLVPHP
jgi:transmembrane sensor